MSKTVTIIVCIIIIIILLFCSASLKAYIWENNRKEIPKEFESDFKRIEQLVNNKFNNFNNDIKDIKVNITKLTEILTKFETNDKLTEELKAELNCLIKEKHEAIKEPLKSARADGDLSENADYSSAHEE